MWPHGIQRLIDLVFSKFFGAKSAPPKEQTTLAFSTKGKKKVAAKDESDAEESTENTAPDNGKTCPTCPLTYLSNDCERCEEKCCG